MAQNDAVAKLTRLMAMGPLELQGLAEQAAMAGAPPPMESGPMASPQPASFADIVGLSQGRAATNGMGAPFAGTPVAPPGAPHAAPYTGGLTPAQLAALPQKPATHYAPAPSIRQAPQVQVAMSGGMPATQRPQTLGQIIRG